MTTLFALLLVPNVGAAADPPVAVRFVHPDRYADANLHGGFGAAARAPTLDAIAKILREQGARHLRAGQSLAIEILDIDLAGRIEPWNVASPGLRVMRPVDWPRIKLRYVLTDGGKAAPPVEAAVSDQEYLQRADIRRADDPWRYERAMLAAWFDRQFGRQD
jgi:hypothetical protein